MATVLAEAEAGGLAMLREIGGVDDEVDAGKIFIAAPETDFIIDGVDASAAFADIIGAEDLGEMLADLFRFEGEGAVSAFGVALEALPVALEGKGDAFRDAEGGKEAPAVEEAGLTGREARLFDGEQTVVVKNEAMNHTILPEGSSYSIAERHEDGGDGMAVSREKTGRGFVEVAAKKEGITSRLTRQKQFAIIFAARWRAIRVAAGRFGGPGISLRVSILASGSSGNATLLETSSTTLLIDSGLGRKEMQRRFEALGRAQPDHIDAILISHEHSDHSSGLPQMQREWDCPAYLTELTHRAILQMLADLASEKTDANGNPRAPKKLERVEYIRTGEKFQIGDIEITPFSIPHDAADPVGYAFRTNGTKVAIVTDLGYLTGLVKYHVREADLLLLESNHDLDMLKLGPYPWYIKQRVMSRTGHLSNMVVGEFFADAEMFDGLTRHLVLGHLSEQNNTPDIAQICAEQSLAARPADFPFRGTLHIASQRTPLGPFEL